MKSSIIDVTLYKQMGYKSNPTLSIILIIFLNMLSKSSSASFRIVGTLNYSYPIGFIGLKISSIYIYLSNLLIKINYFTFITREVKRNITKLVNKDQHFILNF